MLSFTLITMEVLQDPKPHIVFVTGDEEYRSEESMPMLARILLRELDCRITVLYSLDKNGYVDPNATDNLPGTEALKTADLMVIFTRFRNLPDPQLQPILDYAESGKPIVGFRTATHAFRYENDPSKAHLNEEWPLKVFGQKWITHHGHFDDGQNPLTSVSLLQNQKDHPILRGVKPFSAYSWLYHVQGKGHELSGDSQPILTGTALKSAHRDAYPLTNPVAWTKTYTGTSGKPARVFFTTLGHPYDFKDESMRKLALNGIFWALGKESQIPQDGVKADFAVPYTPNNSGMGDKYKKNQKPPIID